MEVRLKPPMQLDPEGSRRRYADETRSAILDAAESCFVDRGFAATSMSEIADRAQVTKSLIHHHFGSKESLWQEVKRRRLEAYSRAQKDLMDLSYPSESFDLVLTSDTLEHVPDFQKGLREIGRIMKPQALHIFTIPVVWDRPRTRKRAFMRGREIFHLLPPSYHGSSNNPSDDRLVFSELGADVESTIKEQGFEVRTVRDSRNPALTTFVTRRKASTASLTNSASRL